MQTNPDQDNRHQTQRWCLGGRIQGVGFRPFVWRLAQQLGVTGWVRNEGPYVSILGHGDSTTLTHFGRALFSQAPAASQAVLIEHAFQDQPPVSGFEIRPSQPDHQHSTTLPLDVSLCADCRDELFDPDNRRYRHPFISCTQCGPRYTITTQLPFDRANTSLATFTPCPACGEEYRTPTDRRFHAQTISCTRCGPQLSYQAGQQQIRGNEAALQACIEALLAGKIIAVKGLSGYHLLCLADDPAPVACLRRRKARPHKPFAVLMPRHGKDGLDAVRRWGAPDERATALLTGPIRPIVLLPATADCPLDWLAPGLKEIGLMLPANPIQELLLAAIDRPLVATSANLSGEPILIDNTQAHLRLQTIADGFLHHDLTLLRPADDPVYRMALPECPPLRRGRADSPWSMPLPQPHAPATLALGAQLKATIALGQHHHALISPHLGDMSSLQALERMEQLIQDLQRLSGQNAARLLCDAHPGYTSRHWAQQQSLPCADIYHHDAHASALYGEHTMDRPMIIFTWDGTGLGKDGHFWGGEALVGQPGRWQRRASLRPFRIAGGEQVSREPWRSAAALRWECGLPLTDAPAHAELLRQAWQRQINCIHSSSAGRLFDAAAALCGLVTTASYDGQAPMWLEASADHTVLDQIACPSPPDPQGIYRLDWQPLLTMLSDKSQPVSWRAAVFHNSLAHALLTQAQQLRRDTTLDQIGLCGGVFQNALLTRRCINALQPHGFSVYIHQQLPSNDAAISYGQLIETNAI